MASVQYNAGRNLYRRTACIISTEYRLNLLEMFDLFLPHMEVLAVFSSPVNEDPVKSF